MSQPLFTFRQLPTVAQMLAGRGLSFDDVLRDAGIADPSATASAVVS